MADLCTRLWLLQANLWLMALGAGGVPTDNSSTWNNTDAGCPIMQQRFVPVRKNTAVYFICYSPEPHRLQWYKTFPDSEELHELGHNTSSYSIQRTDTFINLTIPSVTHGHNGVYVCDSANLTAERRRPRACGTELRVMGHSTLQQFQSRNTLKDAIIIIQSLLLVIFISVPVLLFLDKDEGKKSPEEDHTYEGLEVEQMATYEDITPFRDVKAKWTVGEHPGEE
ncbi:B-cell antigen receptor complex-associated protein beta chain-like [Colius striatus]|nr:B-cell antigen receptor complex-associated protein beta chain-like [Colius striatus]